MTDETLRLVVQCLHVLTAGFLLYGYQSNPSAWFLLVVLAEGVNLVDSYHGGYLPWVPKP